MQVKPPEIPAPSQVPALHVVPPVWRLHPPLPSQVPSRPQEDGLEAGQSIARVGGEPAVMTVHSPRESGNAQDLHLSVQVELQHTPSTQWPLWHSLSH